MGILLVPLAPYDFFRLEKGTFTLTKADLEEFADLFAFQTIAGIG